MSRTLTIFGVHAIQAALESSPTKVRRLWLDQRRNDRRLQSIQDLAQHHRVAVERVTRQALDEMVPDVRHQGVIAEVESSGPASEAELQGYLQSLDRPPFLLILDGVQDPHNLGACLRTADAAGIDAIIAPKDRAVGLTPVVHKVACGAAERVPFIQVTNLARTLRWLKESGIWVVGTDGTADTDLFQGSLTGPLALVMGAEGKGLRRLTREHCDLLIKIPMVGAVESLNVSVATGICLFEALRQRSSAS